MNTSVVYHPARPSLDSRSIHIELRAGEGGADAESFAQELAEALLALTRREGWACSRARESSRTVELVITPPRKERSRALNLLRGIAGVHRIQRIPLTERRGRRHTSTASVAVLESVRASAVDIHPDEVRVEFYRGSGPGGQHRNKVSSAVRLVHRPTGIVITRESGRSQSSNLDSAWAQLREELTERAAAAAREERNHARNAQVAASDRAAKSFTHNHQRDESVCHEDGRTWRMSAFLRGRI